MKQSLSIYYILLLLCFQGTLASLCDNRQTRPIVSDSFCTLTICCGEINDNFIQTFSLIADLQETLTGCCAAIVNKIDNLGSCTVDLSSIFTVLSETKVTLTNCCVTVQNDLDAVLAALLTLTTGCVCAPTPVTAAGTIAAPGFYCLANDITGQITIASDNVVFDLSDREISGGTNGVAINAGTQNVIVRNGRITGTTAEGVLVGNGCVNIEIISLNLVGCGDYGVKLDGTGAAINNCNVQNIQTTSCIGGVQFIDTNNSVIDSCQVVSSVVTTGNGCIDLRSSATGTGNIVSNCLVSTCTIADAGAIFLTNNQNSTISNCVIQNIQAAASTTLSSGIQLSVSPFAVVQGCSIVNVSDASGANNASGIELLNSSNGIINDCVIINILSDATVVAGVHINSSANVVMGNIDITQINASVGQSVGINVVSSPGSLIDNAKVLNLLSTFISTGIQVNDSISCSIQHCIIDSIIGDLSVGIDVISSSTGVVVQESQTINVVSNGTSVVNGIRIFNGSDNPTIQSCIINTVTGQSVTNGILADTASGASIIDCNVQNILINGGSGSGIAASTAANTTVIDCQVSNITGGVNTNIVGIQIDTSDSAIVKGCNIVNVSGASSIFGVLLSNSSFATVAICTINDIVGTTTGGIGIDFSTANSSFAVGCIAQNCSQDAFRIENTTTDSSIGQSKAFACTTEGFVNVGPIFPAANNNQFFDCFSARNNVVGGFNYIGAPAGTVVALGGAPVVGTNIDGGTP